MMKFMSALSDVLLALSDLGFIFKPETKQAVPNIVRLFKGYDLPKRGITLRYARIPRGLFQRPFIIEFGSYLKDFSNGAIDVEAVNTYVLGDFNKKRNCAPRMREISNILDPLCVFKDVWFGAYIVFDDVEGKGRRFILNDHSGDPADCGNFNVSALSRIPEIDQKIITWSSHQNEEGYTRELHDEKFRFDIRGELKTGIIEHMNKQWLDIDGSFETWCIITDRKKTRLDLFSSIRGISGLPDECVYEKVAPWHDIVFHGILRATYLSGEYSSFWFIVYYGASEYELCDGKHVNNWTDDLKSTFERMFEGIRLKVKKPRRTYKKYHLKKYDQYWIPLR